MIIGVAGKKQVGKDTVGNMIQYLTSEVKSNLTFVEFMEDVGITIEWINRGSKWEIKKFAEKVKRVLMALTDIRRSALEKEEVKQEFLGSEWRDEEGNDIITNRMALQWIGTDLFRDNFHPNTWVNALMSEYKASDFDKHILPNWIITDVRFPNEVKAIRERKGILIKVSRETESPENEHESEVALDNYNEYGYLIDNNGTTEELLNKVRSILIKEKLI